MYGDYDQQNCPAGEENKMAVHNRLLQLIRERAVRRTRERAYFLWLAEGKPEGRDREFWARAERDEAAAATTHTTHTHIRRYFAVGLGSFLLISIALFALAGTAEAKGLLVSAVGLGVATASGSVAWLLGLLFGVPRSAATSGRGSTNQHTSDDDPDASGYGINTNLEQISDWLTKTIIGVGLTQLYYIPGYLWHVAEQLNEASLHDVPGGRLFILAIAAAAGSGGFWLGYLYARTSIAQLLTEYWSIRLLGSR
jgi:hypothetical protein